MWKDGDVRNDSSSGEDCKLRNGKRTIMPSGSRSEGEYLKRLRFKYFKAMHWVAFILLLAACLSGCSKIGDQPTAKGPTRELPLAEYRDTTILDMYEGSRLSWV